MTQTIDDLLQQSLCSAQTQTSGVRLYSLAEMLAPQPPLDWIVDGLLLPGSVAIFAGAPGSKKTWALLNMAACVAAGISWLGHETKQVPVLIVDEESGKRRLFERMGKVIRGLGLGDGLPIYASVMAGFDLRDDDSVAALSDLIQQTGAGLVVIDALADVAPGADENSVKDMMPLMTNLRKLAEDLQIAILLIHHSNKAGGDYRGSSAIAGAVALLATVKNTAQESLITFDIVKFWDGEPGKFYAVAQWDSFADTFILTETTQTPKLNLTNAEIYVLKYLGDEQTAELADIQNSTLLFTASTLKTAVVELVKRGYVENTAKGLPGRGRKATYQLTTQGEQVYEQVKNS